MRGSISRRLAGFLSLLLIASTSIHSQTPGSFYWVNFHSPKDQDIVVWVTRSLAVEDFTAIREIGVMYDSALVVTSLRATPQSPPGDDSFNVWNVSLINHEVTPLIKGVDLRWLDFLRFSAGAPLEPTILYDNCRECAPNTYFTAFHYDVQRRQWEARWIQDGEGIPVWNTNHPAGIAWTQVYAVVTGGNGIAQVDTWNHFDFGRGRPVQDTIYRYDVDPFSGLDRTVMLSGKDADATKAQLCSAQDAVTGLARGQDSILCQVLLNSSYRRRPSTSPGGSQGQSAPPGHHVGH